MAASPAASADVHNACAKALALAADVGIFSSSPGRGRAPGCSGEMGGPNLSAFSTAEW